MSYLISPKMLRVPLITNTLLSLSSSSPLPLSSLSLFSSFPLPLLSHSSPSPSYVPSIRWWASCSPSYLTGLLIGNTLISSRCLHPFLHILWRVALSCLAISFLVLLCLLLSCPVVLTVEVCLWVFFTLLLKSRRKCSSSFTYQSLLNIVLFCP